jgi:ATP-binding cassette subfamily C protein
LSDLGEVIREVSVSGRISFFYDRIYSARLKAAGNYATQFVLSGMPRYIVETALILAIALFVVIQIQSGDIVSSAATIGIFLSGGLRLTASLLPLQSALLSIKQSLPHASRALEMLSGNTSKSSVGDFSTSNKQILEPVQVSLDGVSFSYNESEGYTLREISLEISAGSQIAFIGTSGAGKSTLADIILGLLKPSSGAVSVHGLRPHELISLYPGALGYVPQKPGMVSGTIAENIALGVAPEDIDHKRLDKAISDAHLTGLINSLPLGVDTPIGKRHDELSGGQIQRIGLARALYTQPRLLVMDEATRALDAESESEINRALDEMRGSVTVILIAHRLNTIQKSDVVFLIEKGLVADSGTFPDLLRTNKTVMKLAKLMSVRSDEK